MHKNKTKLALEQEIETKTAVFNGLNSINHNLKRNLKYFKIDENKEIDYKDQRKTCKGLMFLIQELEDKTKKNKILKAQTDRKIKVLEIHQNQIKQEPYQSVTNGYKEELKSKHDELKHNYNRIQIK